MPRRTPRFGDVWNIKGGVMGPEPWLIVSTDLYLAELHPDRHADVGRRIRNLIGP